MVEFEASKKSIKSIPDRPGVYMFSDELGQILYVGKANNLKSRVGSYFSGAIEGKTRQMISFAKKISIIKVDSEIEALILESNLVKKYLPKYNSELRDDKSPLYIGFTDERYPRVLTLRQTQLARQKLKWVYGPYVNAGSVRKILKYLRKTFPYCTHRLGRRGCVHSQIGLCSPCPNEIGNFHTKEKRAELRRQYLQTLRGLRRVLDGNIRKEATEIEKRMRQMAREEKFEDAEELRGRLSNLQNLINRPVAAENYMRDPNFIEDVRKKELRELKKIVLKYISIGSLSRIECFDVAHLKGISPTASMVVFIDGEADKSRYRHFKIKQKKGESDFDSMKEVLSRRLRRNDWGRADLVIVDGGKAQVTAAIAAGVGGAPVVGIAKRDERLVFSVNGEFVEEKLQRGPALHLVQRLRDEAHRFARRLHHKNVAKTLRMPHN